MQQDFSPGEIVTIRNSVVSGIQNIDRQIELELIEFEGFWKARFLNEDDKTYLVGLGIISGDQPTIYISAGAIEHKDLFNGSVEDVFDELLE